MVVMLIGERPGLTASDSLSVYMTWDPEGRPGRQPAQLHLQHPLGRPEL